MSKIKADGEKKNRAAAIETEVRRISEPIINAAGFLLWDVIFEKEGAMWYLRILFDRPEGGITTDECETMTAPLNELIDKQAFINEVDILEIGSPGLMKKLRFPEHFKACIGLPVRVTLKDENGKSAVKLGKLDAYDEQSDMFNLNGEQINHKKIIKINLDI
ncbi:MAG: ribosome assembly cofactor RimP [Eubacterium sp.]|jgi:ribosome maturation factor RimP|nr:ribosome assembly cofactor RimP [Eubacterium sp.]